MTTTHTDTQYFLSDVESTYLADAAQRIREQADPADLDAWRMADTFDEAASVGRIPDVLMDDARDAGMVFDGDE